MIRNEAGIVTCKCGKVNKLYGIRFEKIDGQWIYNWAFELNESMAKREGYDTTVIKGDIMPTDDYPGCPYCKTKYFVICKCGRLSCNNSESELFTCPWCGNSGRLTVYDGSGFSSHGDL